MIKSRQNIFTQINNGLILILFVVVGFLFFSQNDVAHSQTVGSGAVSADNSPIPAYIINREMAVKYDPNSWTVHYVSDGMSGKPSDKQKSKFVKGENGSAAQLDLIDIPINFKINEAETKVILPGELVYPAIRRTTAPSSYTCKERDLNNVENESNCLFNVKQLSLLSKESTTSVVIGNQEYKVTPNSNVVIENVIATVKSLFSVDLGVFNPIVTDVGLVDQSRSGVGSINFWGDDSFQQIVPISGGTQDRARILNGVAKATASGSSKSENFFEGQLSAGLQGKVATSYKQANIVRTELNKVVGASATYDPYTSYGTIPTNSTGFNIVDFLLQKITGNDQQFEQKQDVLSAQVALRPINTTDKYGAKYKFCDSFGGRLGSYKPYPNPYENLPHGKRIVNDPVTNLPRTVTDQYYEQYERYNRVSISVRQCISAVAEYVEDGDVAATICAKSYADNESGKATCDEFSVEEDNLNFSQMEKTLPIGFGAYFQNTVLKDLDPSNTTGPYLNYLSPYFCAKLNVVYDLSEGESYMYNVSGKSTDGSSGQKVINQYCVLGGLISNFSWALTQQDKNFSTKNFGAINLPKEALTCDKKETVIFGAIPIKSNIPTPLNELIYATDDNGRGRFDNKDDIAIYNGYNANSLSYIFNNVLKQSAFKYSDQYDIQVLVDPANNRPKYAAFTVVNNPESQSLYVCKIPTDSLSTIITEKTLCKLIDTGGFVVLTSAGFKSTFVKIPNTDKNQQIDTIALVYTDFPSAEAFEKGREVPIIYRYVDIADDSDVNAAFLGTKVNLPYNTNTDFLQLSNGNFVIANFQNKKDQGLTNIKTLLLRPSDIDVTFNDTNTRITEIKHKDSGVIQSEDFCAGKNKNYCSTISKLQYIYKMKLAEDPGRGLVYLTTTGGGMGLVFPVDYSSMRVAQTYVFSFKSSSAVYSNADDYISAVRTNGNGELDMFLGSSGYYLRILFPERMSNSDIAKDVITKCGTNCLLVIQKEFNTSLFTTDCSDYKGSGVCGFTKLNEIKQPRVFAFTYGQTNRILAWYTQQGLDKTILRSPDMLYAYSGLYSQIDGSANEFSNAYIPTLQTVEISEKEKALAPQATAIRYFNYAYGGMVVGDQLLDTGLGIVENPNLNLEKLNCLQNYNSKVTGIDVYFSDTGLKSVDTNPVTTYTSTGNRNTGTTSQNSGAYCEESWCIPDEVPFVNNPLFKGDSSDSAEGIALREKIASYLNRDRSFIDRICKVSSEKGISCAVMAAIWKAETSAKTTSTESNPAFGCFLNTSAYCRGDGAGTDLCKNWYTFDNQVQCAANTLSNRYNEYTPNAVISGPSDRIDKPALTNTDRGGGACVAGTRFSYVFQKYTPLDRRVNNDNQCNPGLVKYSGNDQEYYCAGNRVNDATARKKFNQLTDEEKRQCYPTADYGDPLVYNDAKRNADEVNGGCAVYPTVWGPITETRPNIQNSLIAMDPRLRADNNKCYPQTGETAGDSSASSDIQDVINKYDFSSTSVTGKAAINLVKGWGGTDWASGNVFMLMKEDWQNEKNAKTTGFEGAYVIKPGEEFNFENEINNLGGRYIHRDKNTPALAQTMEEKYGKIQPPWGKETFNFQNGVNKTGGGWCEFFTTWYMAAKQLQGVDGKKFQESISPTLIRYAHRGDIVFDSHTGVTANGYNKMRVEGEELDVETKGYVAVETGAQNFILKNPYKNPGEPDLLIFVKIADDSTISVEMKFGKPKIGSGGPQ